nr:killer cell lectin-like receptor subfamily F member 1 isoform X1 [Pogona vitticeps]
MAQEVIYADLSLSWRTPPAQPKGSDDGELTYETISGPSPQAEQSRSGPGPEGGVKRLLLPIALGLVGISLLLLAAVVGLGAKNWQLSRQLQEASRAHEAQSLSLQAQLEASRAELEQQQQAREVRLNATWSTAWKDLCPKEWVLYQGRCLFFSREKRKWEESRNDCESKAARLLILEPPTVLDPLPGFLYSSDYWIGLHMIQSQKGQSWVWVDGSSSSWTPVYYYNCAALVKGRLEDKSCSSRSQYICEKAARTERKKRRA